MNVHIIDDDTKLHSYLKMYFEDENIDLTSSARPSEAFTYLKHHDNIDIIILDIMLPEMSGFEVCKILKSEYPHLPVIMLTAKGDDIDSLLGLELGADDYIVKPFNPRILLTRINAVLRRTNPEPVNGNTTEIFSKKWNIGLYPDLWKITINSEKIELTSSEFILLKYLMENKGIIQSRDNLINNVKGLESEIFDRTVDVQISRIRHKLNDNEKPHRIIKTIRGVGYVFSDD